MDIFGRLSDEAKTLYVARSLLSLPKITTARAESAATTRAIENSIVLLRSEFVTTEGVPYFVEVRGMGARRLTRIAENTPERKEYI